jgi:hypothetical protein
MHLVGIVDRPHVHREAIVVRLLDESPGDDLDSVGPERDLEREGATRRHSQPIGAKHMARDLRSTC